MGLELGSGPGISGVLAATMSVHLGTSDSQELEPEIMFLNLRARPAWDLARSSPTPIGGLVFL